MSIPRRDDIPHGLFASSLPPNFEYRGDAAERRLLKEYGAIFVARGGVVAPSKIVFIGESEVRELQSGFEIANFELGGFRLELQRTAADALLAAVIDAHAAGLSITPRGQDSARRNYNDTVELWNSRVEPALVHWVEQGRLTRDEAESIRSLSPRDQVERVFELEEQGIFFAKDLSKSIVYSVAPPGASQHLSMLAFDVAEFADANVRRILADRFWYQTVVSDLPHFTFLGVPESDLPGLGLKTLSHADREFWVPDI